MTRGPDPRAPRFVVAGAVKGATTWTARQLAKHPDVFIPGPEPHFFSDQYDQGFEWYLNLFAQAPEGAVIGEKSADYLAHPLAAERLAADLPEARIIVQLRSPVDRAYSDYCMLYRRGETRRPAGDYFSGKAAEDGAMGARFLNGGLYAAHLSRLYQHYPRDQILVLLYDDIAASPEAAMGAITGHIGIAPVEGDLRAAPRENDSASAMLPLPIRKALRPFKKAVKPLRGEGWFRALRGAFAETIDYPPLDDGAREFLTDFYGRDIEELAVLIRRDLSAWLKQPPADGVSSGAAPLAALA